MLNVNTFASSRIKTKSDNIQQEARDKSLHNLNSLKKLKNMAFDPENVQFSTDDHTLLSVNKNKSKYLIIIMIYIEI